MNIVKLLIWSVLVQVFILNNIQFNGYINPYYYIIFIISSPNKKSKSACLIWGFLTGMIIDFFSESYGIHAFSSVLIAYLQPFFYSSKSSYNKISDDGTNIKTMALDFFISRTIAIVVIHHFTLFILEDFSLINVIAVISKTIASSIFTIILLTLHKSLISMQKNEV